MVVASLAGLKTFQAWDQVQLLWDADLNPILLIAHPHLPRYLVAYPGFLLEESFANHGFSLYICAFLTANCILFNKVAVSALGHRPGLPAFITFLAFHLAMNGRGVIAWTAWLLCAWICLETVRTSHLGTRLLWTFPCALLASVSTGVFVVAMVALSMIMLQQLRHSMRRTGPGTTFIVVALTFPLIYMIGDYFLFAIEKNLDFYGGGISGAIAMLEHGLGSIAFRSPVLSTAIALVAFFSAAAFTLVRPRRKFTPLERLIGTAVAGGLFGFTVLTLCIPLLLVALHSWLPPRRTLAQQRAILAETQ